MYSAYILFFRDRGAVAFSKLSFYEKDKKIDFFRFKTQFFADQKILIFLQTATIFQVRGGRGEMAAFSELSREDKK